MIAMAASAWRRYLACVVFGGGAAWLFLGCRESTSPSADVTDSAAKNFADTGRMLPGGTGPQWVWVLRLAGGRYANHVQVVRILRSDAEGPRLHLEVLPSRDWAGRRTSDLSLDADTVRLRAQGELEALLRLTDGTIARLVMRADGERATGTWSELAPDGAVGSYPAIAFRVPTTVLPPDPATLVRVPPDDSIPVVLLRVDDNMPSDRSFAERLIQRRLPGEFAIPTLSPASGGRPSWEELRNWARHGLAMVAHSRRHSDQTASDLDFMEEVLGSLRDLRAQGLPTNIFVQPGSWRDSLYFDSRQKVATWRGALLRTASLVSECYDSPGTIQSPPSDSLALCFSHITISDALTVPQILDTWRGATQAHRFTTFLVHSYRMPSPDFLDFFLDSLSQARSAGRVRIVQSSVDAFFDRSHAPLCGANPANDERLGVRLSAAPPIPKCAKGTD